MQKQKEQENEFVVQETSLPGPTPHTRRNLYREFYLKYVDGRRSQTFSHIRRNFW